nr:Gal-binding and CUB domains containing receptor 10 [Arenicola marina]
MVVCIFFKSVIYVLIARMVLGQVAEERASIKTEEVCSGDTESLSCPTGHVIQMSSATYGRPSYGKCVRAGDTNCSVDALRLADGLCSGRPACNVTNAKRTVEAAVGTPCPELVSFMELRYKCIAVQTTGTKYCPTEKSLVVTGQDGVLSSHVVDITGCGSIHSPWRVEGKPGQRVSLALTNFNWTIQSGNDFGHCDVIGYAIEPSLRKNTSLCASRVRHEPLLTSLSAVVEVHLMNLRETKGLHFVLEYTVVGCADQLPADARYERRGNTSEISCIYDENEWTLTCVGNEWQGDYDNCSKGEGAALPNSGLSPVGTIAVVACLAGLVILLAVLLCGGLFHFKRKQQEAVDSRDPADTAGTYALAASSAGVYFSAANQGEPCQTLMPPHQCLDEAPTAYPGACYAHARGIYSGNPTAGATGAAGAAGPAGARPCQHPVDPALFCRALSVPYDYHNVVTLPRSYVNTLPTSRVMGLQPGYAQRGQYPTMVHPSQPCLYHHCGAGCPATTTAAAAAAAPTTTPQPQHQQPPSFGEGGHCITSLAVTSPLSPDGESHYSYIAEPPMQPQSGATGSASPQSSNSNAISPTASPGGQQGEMASKNEVYDWTGERKYYLFGELNSN